MPELPEVETVKRIVEPQISGQRIAKIIVHNPQVIADMSEEQFCVELAGKIITGMSRRGKFLSIHLADGDRIVLHLRMTGCVLVAPADYKIEKHTHIVFCLENGQEIHFIDQRRFGRFWLIRSGEEDSITGISRLGIEPFDERLTADWLAEKLSKKKKAIKECLLDQTIIAGIGNIYSDEILFRTKIHPSTKAVCLDRKEIERLAEEIPRALAFYIEKNAISPEDYLIGKGKDYRNTPFLNVYGHGGEPCPVCGSTLRRKVIGGRSSVFCPGCQGEE